MREPSSTMPDPAYDVVRFLASDASVDLTSCDREPIHQSGAIQPHGVLLALAEPDLVITWTSENTGVHLGIPPTEVLDRPLAEVLGESAARQLADRLGDPRASGTDPFSFQVAGGVTLEATWHRVDGLVIVELEPTISDGGALMSQLFADVRHAMQALQSTDSVQALCDTAAREI